VPDWLTQSFSSDADTSVAALLLRECTALALGLVVAGIYRVTHGRRAVQARSMMATLVLLTILIGMISSVIGDNIARAFSLVGALAIVRFRTVVEDTRDTAFVIFAVGVGMAIGAGYLKVPLVCIPVAAVAAFMFRPRDDEGPAADGRLARDYTLVLRVGTHVNADALLAGSPGVHLALARPISIATARQGAAFEHTYAVRLKPTATPAGLVTQLNATEGVQGVELRGV
jgi:hypothetical protein